MSKWIVKKGNTSVQEILIKDKNGDIVQNLSDTSEIKFQVKRKPTDSATLIEKTKGSGIEVDTPLTGNLRITLDPADTDIAAGDWYMGLQLKWTSPAQTFEIMLSVNGRETDRFKVVQDVVS